MTAAQLDRETLKREAFKELARRKLIWFAKYVNPQYKPSQCHEVLAEALEKVLSGEVTRLKVNFPRRHGKSELVSKLMPAFGFGQDPRLRFVQSGYAENLTVTHSRKARDIVGSPRFHDLFPKVAQRAAGDGQGRLFLPVQTAHEWGTTKGGNYYAVGVGGGLAGRGYHVGILDDVIKGRKEAASKLNRDNTHDWYRSVFYPAQDSDEVRKEAAIIICMTRWDVDDLSARVELDEGPDGEKEQWLVLNLPAVSSPDGKPCDFDVEGAKALWPERWPLEKLRRIRAVIGGREFSAQYQQQPRDDEGAVLDSRKLVMIASDRVPKCVRETRHWDLAFSENKGSDYAAGPRMGLMEDGRRVIKHIKRVKGRWPAVKAEIKRLAGEDGQSVVVSIECNGTQLGYYQDVADDPEMANYMVVMYKPEGSKEMRASMWGSRLDDQTVLCVEGEWNRAFFDEMDFFPGGAHDDQVDGVSGGWFQLGQNHGALDERTAKEVLSGGSIRAWGSTRSWPGRGSMSR